jgi:predicted AAA+ superfamily ATPase
MSQVRIISYQGKNGGFATSLSDLWRVELFNGSQSHSFYSPMVENHYTSELAARKNAQYWADFLGWSIVYFVEKKTWQSTLTIDEEDR